jgi:hypothetical protein
MRACIRRFLQFLNRDQQDRLYDMLITEDVITEEQGVQDRNHATLVDATRVVRFMGKHKMHGKLWYDNLAYVARAVSIGVGQALHVTTDAEYHYIHRAHYDALVKPVYPELGDAPKKTRKRKFECTPAELDVQHRQAVDSHLFYSKVKDAFLAQDNDTIAQAKFVFKARDLQWETIGGCAVRVLSTTTGLEFIPCISDKHIPLLDEFLGSMIDRDSYSLVLQYF